jgi:tRNA U34 5-methylaminomethyl-2-thiouridine-forming methyltransferase MnmC
LQSLNELQIVETADGSHTIFLPDLNESYHSMFGAITESECVFFKNGLQHYSCKQQIIHVLETGMGTGLNAFMAFLEAEKNKQHIVYHTLEIYPIPISIASKLNYPQQLNAIDFIDVFMQLHSCNFDEEIKISEYFTLKKSKQSIKQFCNPNSYDIIFFDAFAPEINADLWHEDVLINMYTSLKQGGMLTTYCAKGQFKRNLKNVGFTVQNVSGPPGKREITLAFKFS